MKTKGPTDATACLHRRVKSSPLAPPVGVTQQPCVVSSTTVDVLSSTLRTGMTRRFAALARLPLSTQCWIQWSDGACRMRHPCAYSGQNGPQV